MIFHIAEKEAWNASLREGWYQAPYLAVEGFIHCSNQEQVVRVADFLFKGRTDLILLGIDERRLVSRLKYEGETDEHFPHIYGKLNTDAVVKVYPFQPEPNGTFKLPQSLN